jgi:hypothetical protein
MPASSHSFMNRWAKLSGVLNGAQLRREHESFVVPQLSDGQSVIGLAAPGLDF